MNPGTYRKSGLYNFLQLYMLIDKPLKGGDRRVRIFSAHNNWWATPEVSLPLPYQRSAKIFLNFFATRSEDNVLL